MTKEKYMALADFQTLWTNSLKPYIVAGFIAMLAGTDSNAKNLVLADGTNIAQSTFIAATEKGANSGVATLDATGKVPSSQLPSFVDDVIEGYYYDSKFYEEAAHTTEITPEGGKIYIDLATEKTYRWGGSTYAEISAGLALGETQGTAYEGSKGAANAAAIAAHTGNSDIHVTTSDKTAWNAKYDKPAAGIPSTDMSQAVQDSLALADSAIQSHQDISGKADKSEMSIAAVSGDDTKKTITLKDGLSQDVLVAHQSLAGKQDNITASGILKGDGDGGVTAATAGTDYQTPLVAGTDYQTPIVFNTAYNASTNKAATMSDLPEVPERVSESDLAGFVV